LRSVYLVTYSQANLEIVPTRESFADIVIGAFRSQTPATPIQWVCSREPHQNGGVHYHLAVKLNKQNRWLKVRNFLSKEHGININFTAEHSNYYTAFTYVTKEDDDYVTSEGHPDLDNGPPRTMAASQARHSSQVETDHGVQGTKKKRLSAYDVSCIITSRGLKTPLEVMALAKVQRDEGKHDLYEFIINKGKASVRSLCHLLY